MRLCDIKDPENLRPKSKYIKEPSAVYLPFEDIGFNTCLAQYNALDVGVDVEKLAQVIANERCTSIEYGREYAKFIAASADKWLVLGRGK